MDEEKIGLAGDVLAALKSDDPEEFAEALEAFVYACGEESEEEPAEGGKKPVLGIMVGSKK